MRRILPALLLISASVFLALKIFPGITMRELTVVTVPGGVSIQLNGVQAGFAPMTRYVPTDGVHVSASRAGFFSRDTLLTSVPDTLHLQLLQGALIVVNTDPAGCTVRTGDTVMTSPCSLTAMPGFPVELEVTGSGGVRVVRTVNVISPEVKVVSVALPEGFLEAVGAAEFTVVPGNILPFATGTITAGRDEVTVEQFCIFMNDVDPSLSRDSFTIRGRTLLMDSILRSNWHGPVAFNQDTTAYAPWPGMADHPVTGVTQSGAEWYCSWLTENSASGLVYRLPDRNEWAALAEAAEPPPANFSDVNETILTRHPGVDDGWSRTAPSGAMGYNALGLGHMQGNVWEWTSEPGTAAGGSWLSSMSDCTAGSVIRLDPELGYPFTGFRVVASGEPGNITMDEKGETGVYP